MNTHPEAKTTPAHEAEAPETTTARSRTPATLKPTYLIATWFGLGYSKIAPGTMGALGTLPLFFALRPLGAGVLFATACALTIAGVFSAQRVATELAIEDPSLVVIDEVVGVLFALAFVAHGPLWLLTLAFLLFRLLDILKPGPIAALERLRPPGIGIMADDVAAGLLAGALCWLVSGYV